MFGFQPISRRLVSLAASCFILTIGGSVSAGQKQDTQPPAKGGTTRELGMPPVWKGYAGAELNWYEPSGDRQMMIMADFGLYKSLGSPVIGIGSIGVEGYAGLRSTEFDGGGRAIFSIPSFGLGLGADYNGTDEDFSFLLRLNIPIRRSGIVGHGSAFFVQWLPGRGNTIGAGLNVPLWGSNLGKTRPRSDSVRLVQRDPQRLPEDQARPELAPLVASVQERVRWIARLSQPFADQSGADAAKAMAPDISILTAHIDSVDAEFPSGHTLEEEIRVYHQTLDRAFSLALYEEGVTELGETVSSFARQYLLDDVIYPYNHLLGQRKQNDGLDGYIAVAQAEFAQWLLASTDIEVQAARNCFWVFQSLCDVLEETRETLDKRWEDSRFVWLPLQCGLKLEEYDSQPEMNAIIDKATKSSFSPGTRVWYVMNEQFQWEVIRSVRKAEDYHVLWIHDIRGHNGQGKPDEMAFIQVKNYLEAMIERVNAYDATGKLPMYMIVLDQHYFELNKSRIWLRLLREPLDQKVNLPKGYEAWEEELADLQTRLGEAVDGSTLLGVQRSQYGEKWLKNQIKVHINITNPADFSFVSFHVAGIIPIPDNMMRDHRKIAFYDITEEDPYKGRAMFTGMGIGEHYIGANWEDRAIMMQGPEALVVKDAARQLFLNQGFEAEEVPFPLKSKPMASDYWEEVEAYVAGFAQFLHTRGEVLQLHNQTGFRPKLIDPAKAVMYSLMPKGSVLMVPDSLWQSYIYASLLAGSALRGCRVLIIAPRLESAPSAAAPTMARAHGLMSRLIVFENAFEDQLDRENGLLHVGMYAPQQGVGDIAGRFTQALHTNPSWAELVYPHNLEFEKALRNVPAQLDSIGYEVGYITAADSLVSPKLHLKANFISSKEGWDNLAASSLWGWVLWEYVDYLASQSTSSATEEELPDVERIPAELSASMLTLAEAVLKPMPPEEIQKITYYLTVGSVNMDYRSMSMDGEVMIVMSGWQALVGAIDFMLLAGMCEWPNTQEELDALLPSPGGLTRSVAGLMKLSL